MKSDTGFFDANTLLGLGVGYACKKGLKPESPNQDDFFIVRYATSEIDYDCAYIITLIYLFRVCFSSHRIDDWGLYGVFDGRVDCFAVAITVTSCRAHFSRVAKDTDPMVMTFLTSFKESSLSLSIMTLTSCLIQKKLYDNLL